MKRSFLTFLSCCFLTLPAFSASVVASVNGTPITDTDITARTTLMNKQGKTSTDNRKQALQNIIDDNVKLTYASNFGAVPDDEDVEKELKKLNLGDLSASEKAMAKSAMKADIAWQIVVARTVLPRKRILESEYAAGYPTASENNAVTIATEKLLNSERRNEVLVYRYL